MEGDGRRERLDRFFGTESLTKEKIRVTKYE